MLNGVLPAMHDILLTVLILFSGFVPVSIALYYSKELLKTAKMLYELGKAERNATVKDVKEWMLGEEFGDHIQHVIKGAYGRDVRKVKDAIKEEAYLQGLPPPVKKTIAKGVAGFFEDYGMSKKTVKGIEATMEMIFNRKSPQQKTQQEQMIKQMASQYGYPVQPDTPVVDNSLYP